MLNVIYVERHTQALYAKWHYAKCRCAECHYAECRYADCRYAECHGPVCTACKSNFVTEKQSFKNESVKA
jgi:hypothetical protein